MIYKVYLLQKASGYVIFSNIGKEKR